MLPTAPVRYAHIVRVCVFVRVHCTCSRLANTCAHTHEQTHTRARINTYTHTHTHTHIHTHTHSHTHARTHVHTHAHIRTRTQTHTQVLSLSLSLSLPHTHRGCASRSQPSTLVYVSPFSPSRCICCFVYEYGYTSPHVMIMCFEAFDLDSMIFKRKPCVRAAANLAGLLR